MGVFHVFKMIQIVPNQAKRHTFSREVTIFPISNYALDSVISAVILKSSLPFHTLASRDNEVLGNLIWFCDSALTGIKVKNIEKKHFCCHDKNYYFCKSNISALHLIVGSRNKINFKKYEFVKKWINGERRFY